jgi:hypothetical protein
MSQIIQPKKTQYKNNNKKEEKHGNIQYIKRIEYKKFFYSS